ncbi:hypothetical protein V6O07_10705, partial [Arthrospira platensis SPKY2]
IILLFLKLFLICKSQKQVNKIIYQELCEFYGNNYQSHFLIDLNELEKCGFSEISNRDNSTITEKFSIL